MLLETIEQAAMAGVDWIQLREKDLTGREFAALARASIQCAKKISSNVSNHFTNQSFRVIVNDRLDIALSERAGGVHFGETGLPIGEVRRLLQEHEIANVSDRDFLLGVSCHSLESAKIAMLNGADYIFFGPVFDTPSKISFGPPRGLEHLAEICQSISIPVVAIGGITLNNAESCLRVGAAGIAAIRLFQDAADIMSIVRSLR